MNTPELLALIDANTRLTTPVAVWRLLDGQLVHGTEGRSLSPREIREHLEAQAAA